MRECKNLKVKITKPTNTRAFLDALEALRASRRKAPNLLFEEIEHDIIDKEKFVIE
jgi:hypothetical protein